MIIKAIELRKVRMPLREPFVTSYGVERDKEFLLVFLETDAVVGVGECVALSEPLYSSETYATAWQVLVRHLIPAVLGIRFEHPRTIRERLAPFRGNRMAKAAIETAAWDAYAKMRSEPLFFTIGGKRREIPAGISVGIQATTRDLLNKIESYLQQGYRRVKIKVTPERGEAAVAAIRQEFGDIPLMVDANSAYTIHDVDLLRRLDDYHLLMIEQPLAYDDIFLHAQLQRTLQTPICLDESLQSLADVQNAVEIGACRIVNLKIGRVGGLAEAIEIEAYCRSQHVPLWCGGMLEAGVGRLFNLALSSLEGFALPGDTGPSSRYFENDIIDPPVEFARPGFLALPDGIGIGAELKREQIDRLTEFKNRSQMS